ncbi:MAG: hypothetical protein AABY33_10925 [Pseudomonadota bacterium]
MLVNNLHKIKLIVFTLCLLPNFSYAGAWTKSQGKGLLIQNFSYYSTDKYFDNSGNTQPINSYAKYELNPYIEYGLRDWLTIGANLFVERASQNGDINWGIGDSEFFARVRLLEKDSWVFSLEPMVKLPSLDDKTDTPKIGNNNFDSGLTLAVGYGFKYRGLDHFINVDSGYRHRLGTPRDQLKFSATAGISVTNKTKILSQVFHTRMVTGNNSAIFTQSSSDDYDLTKLQISGMYKIYDSISLQVGAFTNVAGRNTGSGDGGLLAISKEF